jgi:hypothetical protein
LALYDDINNGNPPILQGPGRYFKVTGLPL